MKQVSFSVVTAAICLCCLVGWGGNVVDISFDSFTTDSATSTPLRRRILATPSDILTLSRGGGGLTRIALFTAGRLLLPTLRWHVAQYILDRSARQPQDVCSGYTVVSQQMR